jgi:NAD(P)-dependent dehydrogenase (short-subunit alcohol dehydrogenase family)
MSQSQSVQRRLAVIAGGAMGIGGATVRKFAALGWSVAIFDRDTDTASKLAAELSRDDNIAVFAADITSASALSAAAAAVRARFPGMKVHAAVNSVGVFDERAGLFKIELDGFRKLMEVNLFGAFLFSRTVEPLLDDEASLIHVGSVNGTQSGGGLGAYKTSKAALHMMARCMARELARDPRRIRVNVVAPGWVDTPGERRVMAASGRPGDLDDPESAKWIPLGRRTEAAEVAATIAFLCSDEAASITGQVVHVDGGVTG